MIQTISSLLIALILGCIGQILAQTDLVDVAVVRLLRLLSRTLIIVTLIHAFSSLIKRKREQKCYALSLDWQLDLE